MQSLIATDDAVKQENDIYLQVRAGFIQRGTSLNAWCIAHGIKRQSAEAALKHLRNGKKASALREKLKLASGMK